MSKRHILKKKYLILLIQPLVKTVGSFVAAFERGPITFDINLRTRKVDWYLKKEGVCILAQKLYDNFELFKEHFEAAKAEMPHLICELDSDFLRGVLKIKEPKTTCLGK